jgi:hypothetical protein
MVCSEQALDHVPGVGIGFSHAPFRHTNQGTMILIRVGCTIVAVAIIAAVSPPGRSDAVINQVSEMPNGLTYADAKTGDGTEATATF